MKKYIILGFICFFFIGCANTPKKTPAGAYGNNPPMSEEKRAKAQDVLKEWEQFQNRKSDTTPEPIAGEKKISAPETPKSLKEDTGKLDKPSGKDTAPVPPAYYEKKVPTTAAEKVPLLNQKTGNPAKYEKYATKDDLKALASRVDENTNDIATHSKVLKEHDEKIATLWLDWKRECQKAKKILPLKIDFGFGKEEIGPVQKKQISYAAGIINKAAEDFGRDLELELEGYSSEPGDAVKNQKKSDKRALAVDKELAPQLKNAKVVDRKGFGESNAGSFNPTNQKVRIIIR